MKQPEHTPEGGYLFSNQKRWIDFVLGAVCLGPAELVKTWTIRKLRPSLDEGPSIITQERMGGVLVDKIRTMRQTNANDELAKVLSVWDSSNINDPRVPGEFAKLVRRMRADETPQVRQVLLGAILGRGRNGTPRLSLAGTTSAYPMHQRR